MTARAATALLPSFLLFLAYAALAAWWLWPLPTVWQDHSAVFGRRDFGFLNVADWYLIVWVLAWGTHALLTQPFDLFAANTFFPTEHSLAYSEHMLGWVPLFAPTYLISGNPVLATNVAVFLTYPLGALAMYALARRWLSAPAAAVAGAFYVFAPFRYLASPHFHMLGTVYLPLALLFTDRWLERARLRDAAGFAVSVSLQCLSSVYLGYALILAYAAFLPAALWHWRPRLDRRRLTGLALALVAGFGPVVATSIPYLTMRKRGLIPAYDDAFDVPPLGLIPYFATTHALRYLTETGIGFLGYALGALALLPHWRRHRWPLAIGLLLAAWGTLVSFGPTILVLGKYEVWSPYRLLMSVVPGFDTVRQPGRFAVVAQLGFALLAGIGCARAFEVLPARLRWAAAFAVVALALRIAPLQPPLPLEQELTGERVPAAYRWLAEHGDGRALLELPGLSFAQAAERMYLSTFHWLPIVQGYSAYTPPTPEHLNDVAAKLPSEAALQELVDFADVGWLLVHLDELAPGERVRWDEPLPSGLEEAGRFGSDLVLRVTRPVANDRRARLTAASHESLGGAPLGPIATPCSGELRWTDAATEWKVAQEHFLHVELWNHGERAWPGPAVYPRDSLQLRASVLRADGSVATSSKVPMPSDVRPGSSAQAIVPLGAQWQPGEYVVRIEVFQRSGGTLDRCGVPPLEHRLAVR